MYVASTSASLDTRFRDPIPECLTPRAYLRISKPPARSSLNIYIRLGDLSCLMICLSHANPSAIAFRISNAGPVPAARMPLRVRRSQMQQELRS